MRLLVEGGELLQEIANQLFVGFAVAAQVKQGPEIGSQEVCLLERVRVLTLPDQEQGLDLRQ